MALSPARVLVNDHTADLTLIYRPPEGRGGGLVLEDVEGDTVAIHRPDTARCLAEILIAWATTAEARGL